MAITITIANEKGGVGKTTTAVNLASGLALRLSNLSGAEGRILLVDMDPQGHALMATAYDQKPAPPTSIQRMLRRSSHHANLFVVPSNHAAMVKAARTLPTLMANETRLLKSLAPIASEFAYIIVDTPPNTGDLLINSLVAANLVLVPVETSYLGVSGLLELMNTIEQVRTHFRSDLRILGYLPTLCDEQRVEAQEILAELQRRYPGQVLPPIHKAADLAYAHSSHMDIFTYRPPRNRTTEQISSSARATQEYAALVEIVFQRTRRKN
jgi:chromosome partitioning protein